MTNLSKIEGIGAAYAAKLAEVGVETIEALLVQGAAPKGRMDLSKNTGISTKLILTWINHADLFRVNGVGEEYADLLEAAGVDTVPELAQRNPENLHMKMVQVNQEKNLVRKLPSPTQVQSWVEQAKALPRKISY